MFKVSTYDMEILYLYVLIFYTDKELATLEVDNDRHVTIYLHKLYGLIMATQFVKLFLFRNL